MEAESLTACPFIFCKKSLVFNIPFTQNVLQIPPDQSTFAGTGVGIYNKIVHEFLPYVLVYHSMFDRNLQTFNTVQAGNLTFIFYTLQKDKKEPVCEETDRQEEINDLSCRRR